MEVRRARETDKEAIMDIYARAREFMAEQGNPTQWDESYPSSALVDSDIQADGYVVVEDDAIIGVFVLSEHAQEPSYKTIDGAWLNDEPYAVIHRCASDGIHKGVGSYLMDWCSTQCSNIRIDTHEDNIPMRNLLKKKGYEYCGKIHYFAEDYGEDLGERLAFQRITPAQ